MPTCPTCRTHYPQGASTCEADGAALLPDEAFTADPDLKAGDQVGEYQIEGKLGEGGFGSVYRAVHPLIGKAAAIKVLNRQYSSNPQMVSRFIAEARAVNQIRNRNIIDIFSFGRLDDGRQFYVMELLDGVTFDGYLRQKGRLPPDQAIAVLRGIARALDAAHAAGIAHRDLKPENIFLAFEDEGVLFPKLLDFGIAKLLGESTGGGHKTRTGTPLGTPNYMSPEQCRGKNVDHRTDIYSFGILVHVALTGKLPFEGEDVMEVLVKHVSAPAPRVSEVCPDLPAALDAPVLQMLEKDPAQRPASLTAALDALAAAAQSAGYSVQPSGRMSAGGDAGKVVAGVCCDVTPAQVVAMAEAQTLVQGGGSGSMKTLQPSETDVKPAGGRRTLVYAGVGVAALAAIGAMAAMRSSRPVNDGSSPDLHVAQPGTTALPGALAKDTPTVTPGTQATPGVTAAAPELPAEVELTIKSTPAVVDVFLGKEKLGASDKPIRVKRSATKVKLTFKAAGYLPQDLDVEAGATGEVPVTLTRVKKSEVEF